MRFRLNWEEQNAMPQCFLLGVTLGVSQRRGDSCEWNKLQVTVPVSVAKSRQGLRRILQTRKRSVYAVSSADQTLESGASTDASALLPQKGLLFYRHLLGSRHPMRVFCHSRRSESVRPSTKAVVSKARGLRRWNRPVLARKSRSSPQTQKQQY